MSARATPAQARQAKTLGHLAAEWVPYPARRTPLKHVLPVHVNYVLRTKGRHPDNRVRALTVAPWAYDSETRHIYARAIGQTRGPTGSRTYWQQIAPPTPAEITAYCEHHGGGG